MINSNIILSVHNLSVFYRKDKPVLKDLSFEIVKGEFVSLLGPSGTGKTTLLNAIASLIPFQGTIEKKSDLSYVFQDKSLFPWMTVKQNIFFGLNNLEKSAKFDILKSILEKVNLDGYEDRYPHELSGGQAQRVSIARSLAFENNLVLCDEPFSALDGITKSKIIEWFSSMIDGTKTFLFVTHNIDDAITLSDRIFVLNDHSISEELIIKEPRPFRQNAAFWPKLRKYKQIIDKMLNSDLKI